MNLWQLNSNHCKKTSFYALYEAFSKAFWDYEIRIKPRTAVDRDFRRQGYASALFNAAIRLIYNETVKVVNTGISCTAITSFLESRGIPIRGQQFGMMPEF